MKQHIQSLPTHKAVHRMLTEDGFYFPPFFQTARGAVHEGTSPADRTLIGCKILGHRDVALTPLEGALADDHEFHGEM